MSDDIHKKRDYVEGLYHGDRWKNRVRRMSDEQVVAIYLRELAKAAEKTKPKPKPKESGEDEAPF